MSRLQIFLDATRPVRYLQFIIAVAIFCYAALVPSPPIVGQHQDSGMHFIGNVLLYLSAWLALWRRISHLKLLMLLLPFSCLIEFAQYFSPGRQVDLKDMAVNVAGLCVGFMASLIIRKITSLGLK